MSENQYLRFSRREFLTAAAGAGAATSLGPAWTMALADAMDPRISQVMSRTIGIDMHNHVYPAGTEPHPGQRSSDPEQQASELFLEPVIKKSGLTAVCASFVLDFTQTDKLGDALNNYLRWLTVMDAQLESGHIGRALNVNDLRNAHDSGQPTIIQSIEGAQFIEGHLDRVEMVYKRGVRHLQLLHIKDDMVSPLGDTIERPAHLGGLTPFGAQVIHECNRLGILVDLAHGAPETVQAAVKVSTQPIIMSHTGLDARLGSNPKLAQMMKSHLISKEHAKVVADAGGVIGVWTKLADTPKDFVENIRATVDTIGIDHVGIGTDLDLLSSRAGQRTSQAWPGITSGFFYVVVGEMLRQGFIPDEIIKVGGGNFCRVFGKATADHVTASGTRT